MQVSGCRIHTTLSRAAAVRPRWYSNLDIGDHPPRSHANAPPRSGAERAESIRRCLLASFASSTVAPDGCTPNRAASSGHPARCRAHRRSRIATGWENSRTAAPARPDRAAEATGCRTGALPPQHAGVERGDLAPCQRLWPGDLQHRAFAPELQARDRIRRDVAQRDEPCRRPALPGATATPQVRSRHRTGAVSRAPGRVRDGAWRRARRAAQATADQREVSSMKGGQRRMVNPVLARASRSRPCCGKCAARRTRLERHAQRNEFEARTRARDAASISWA